MTAYQGGKKRLGKELYQVIEDFSFDVFEEDSYSMPYFEPFCGMCGVLVHFSKNTDKNITASDINEDIIMMWESLQNGWKPPTKCSEKEYMKLKHTEKCSAKRGFIGVTCSFGGQFFRGNYRSKSAIHDFVKSGKKGVMDAVSHMPKNKVNFIHSSYDEFNPQGMIIYCDPPYVNNKVSNEYFEKFDHSHFWDVMRKWSESNLVFISEKVAPLDFCPIWEKEYKVSFLNQRSGSNKKKEYTEQLFVHNKFI